MEDKESIWRKSYGGEKMKKSLIYLGVIYALYFPRSCSHPSDLGDNRRYSELSDMVESEEILQELVREGQR